MGGGQGHPVLSTSEASLRFGMRRSDHVLLVGEGALRFARMHGFEEQDLLTERARKRWLRWRETLSTRDDWVDPSENGDFGKEFIKRDTGTIHVGCVNQHGDLAGCPEIAHAALEVERLGKDR